MAYAVEAQPAIFDGALIKQSFANLEIIRSRKVPKIGAFFAHKHQLHGLTDHVGTANGMGFLEKNSLIYCVTLRELQMFEAYGAVQGYTLHDGKILPAIISLDHDHQNSWEEDIFLGDFLEGTSSVIAIQYVPLPLGVVETEQVFNFSGSTVSKVSRVPAQVEMSLEGLEFLPVMYCPDIVCGHAHANDQYTEKTFHSHWNEKIQCEKV